PVCARLPNRWHPGRGGGDELCCADRGLVERELQPLSDHADDIFAGARRLCSRGAGKAQPPRHACSRAAGVERWDVCRAAPRAFSSAVYLPLHAWRSVLRRPVRVDDDLCHAPGLSPAPRARHGKPRRRKRGPQKPWAADFARKVRRARATCSVALRPAGAVDFTRRARGAYGRRNLDLVDPGDEDHTRGRFAVAGLHLALLPCVGALAPPRPDHLFVSLPAFVRWARTKPAARTRLECSVRPPDFSRAVELDCGLCRVGKGTLRRVFGRFAVARRWFGVVTYLFP